VTSVLAIACGIVEGRALGDNARAALISRGLAELLRLGRHLDVKSESLMGLAGLGDLVLTCTSGTSRNYSLGVELGRGRALDDILKERRSIAEGVWTADALHGLAKQRGIDMPIVHAVHSLLHEGAGLDQVIGGLLTRPFTSE
jgi:glycerol-3-phosphate dehydrogenase (NAD(P)+)